MENRLYAGFSRVDITPEKNGIPLAGYGASHLRLAETILDRCYGNAVAFGTDGKPECVFLVLDLCIILGIFDPIRETVSRLTGIPKERVYVHATHTHSSPDIRSDLPVIREYCRDFLPEKAGEAARNAVRDLRPASISIARTEIGNEHARLNFIRHYFMTEIESKDEPARLYPVGDNYGNEYASRKDKYRYVGHDGTPDHEMRIIKISREGASDILLLNFQTHATLTGGRDVHNMSSDFPGVLRETLEKMFPSTHAVYFQGAAGNLNPKTRIREEGLDGLTYANNGEFDHRGYAFVLASYVRNALRAPLREVKSVPIAFESINYTGAYDHSRDALVPLAEKVAALHKSEGYTDSLTALLREYGFSSPYQCSAIIAKASAPQTGTFELNAVRIGDIAFITAPFELFSETGMSIRKKSPAEMTFIAGYGGEHQTYLPCESACKICYERDISRYVAGTAERIEDEYERMLHSLFEKDNNTR